MYFTLIFLLLALAYPTHLIVELLRFPEDYPDRGIKK